MSSIEKAPKEAMAIQGAIGVALVDYTSGMTLGVMGGGSVMDMNVAAAGNTDVVRAKMRAVEMLALNEDIEDVLITLDSQYHLIRLLRGKKHNEALFLVPGIVQDPIKPWPRSSSASNDRSRVDCLSVEIGGDERAITARFLIHQ